MPSDPRDYKVELSGRDPARPSGEPARGGRPFISVNYACCGAYQRIYRDPAGKEYRGRCPRCGKPVRFIVGDGGTDVRSFTVA